MGDDRFTESFEIADLRCIIPKLWQWPRLINLVYQLDEPIRKWEKRKPEKMTQVRSQAL